MTIVINHLEALEQFKLSHSHQSIALVPTMGNLHDGHLSLVKQAKQHAEKVMVSIYVNPTQFGENEDLNSYPKTFDEDLRKLKKMGVNALFFPKELDIYPYGAENSALVSMPKSLTHKLCGLSRPTHFQGVATVVAKLLQLIQPHMAIFGKKDYQQLAVVKRLCEELFIPTKILGGEIIREPSGLAMSSRNQYLTEQEKQKAAYLYQSLLAAKQAIQSGEKVEIAISNSVNMLEEQSIFVEYFQCCDKTTLSQTLVADNAILLLASQIGSARLIDNLAL